jgi:superfamily II DNA/RNA helicase
MDVNFPELRDTNLQELGRYFQATLGHQTPIGGMSGGVNNRLVKQFRMPGYPYVLVTTDVLQEGEDLHTFCARVYHYGITWTPSAMEQRTGRVDRIGSLTHRRLDGKMAVNEDMFLQVYYPHLSETVELVQVREVFKRINRFLEMMHEAIPSSWRESTTLEVSSQIIRALDPVPSMKTPLRSSFEVKEEFLRGDSGWIPKWDGNQAEKNLLLFEEFMTVLDKTFEIEWDEKRWRWERAGEMWLVNGEIVKKGGKTNDGRRQQFRMSLCTSVRGGMLLLKCSSPIGVIDHENGENMFADILKVRRKLRRTKLVANSETTNGSYMLNAETHLLFDYKFTQMEEILDAVRSTTICADEIERRVWRADKHYDLITELEEEEDNHA